MIQRIGCPRLAASRTVVQLVSMQHFGDDNFLGGPFLPGQVQIEECALPRLDLWPSGHELGGPARSMYARTRSRHSEASPLKNAAFAPPCLSAITASSSAKLQAVGLGRYITIDFAPSP